MPTTLSASQSAAVRSIFGSSFAASGEEIQPNDKRYGVDVASTTVSCKVSLFSSGTTGREIAANGANGVTTDSQGIRHFQVGSLRYQRHDRRCASSNLMM